MAPLYIIDVIQRHANDITNRYNNSTIIINIQRYGKIQQNPPQAQR